MVGERGSVFTEASLDVAEEEEGVLWLESWDVHDQEGGSRSFK